MVQKFYKALEISLIIRVLHMQIQQIIILPECCYTDMLTSKTLGDFQMDWFRATCIGLD